LAIVKDIHQGIANMKKRGNNLIIIRTITVMAK